MVVTGHVLVKEDIQVQEEMLLKVQRPFILYRPEDASPGYKEVEVRNRVPFHKKLHSWMWVRGCDWIILRKHTLH